MRRMRRAVTKKRDGHCSKCGDPLWDGDEYIPTHQCDPAVLRQMEASYDASMSRDSEPKTRQTFEARLRSGFAMLNDDFEPE